MIKKSTNVIERVGVVKNNIGKDLFKKVPNNLEMENNSTIEDLLFKLLSATSIESLPDTVMLHFDSFKNDTLSINDSLNLIQLTSNLSASKFGKKTKTIKYGIILDEPIPYDVYKNINKGAVMGIGRSLRTTSLEEAQDYWRDFVKKSGGWPSKLILPAGRFETNDFSIADLTFRQQQIANLIKNRGLTNYQIAELFGISEQAVKIHVSAILKKYAVKNRAQLILAMNNF